MVCWIHTFRTVFWRPGLSMPQFEVPGWSVPSEPQPIKKRKRQTENVKSGPPAAPNLEKLVKKLKAPSVSKPRKTQRRALKSKSKGQDEDVPHETSRGQRNEGRLRSEAPSPSPTLLTRLCKMESDVGVSDLFSITAITQSVHKACH